MISTPESIMAAQDYLNTCQIDKDFHHPTWRDFECINIDLIQKRRNKRNIESWKAKMKLYPPKPKYKFQWFPIGDDGCFNMEVVTDGYE
jgi:hypothetical protein